MVWSNIQKLETGMTLIELLIVLFISLLVIAGSYSLFGMVFQGYTTSEDKTSEFEKMRNVANVIGRDIRQGTIPVDGVNSVYIPLEEELYIFFYDKSVDRHRCYKYYEENSNIKKRVLCTDDSDAPQNIPGDYSETIGTPVSVMEDVYHISFEDVTEDDGDRRLVEIEMQLDEDGEAKTFQFLTRSGHPPY